MRQIDLVDMVPRSVMPIKQKVSRGAQKIEHRVMTVTAYTSLDSGMNGRGVTASGEKVLEGKTIAADPSIALGTRIYIPALNHTYTVTDRGGAITEGKLDIYMESRDDAMEFGVQELEVWIKYP